MNIQVREVPQAPQTGRFKVYYYDDNYYFVDSNRPNAPAAFVNNMAVGTSSTYKGEHFLNGSKGEEVVVGTVLEFKVTVQ